MNEVVLRQFGDRLYLTGELTKIFREIETYEKDRYESLHLHNDLWKKINHLIGENDTEFRYKVANIIIELGRKQNEEKETRGKTGRRTVAGET